MFNKTILGVSLILVAAILTYWVAFSESDRLNGADHQKPEPQTAQEREYILANQQLIDVAAYVFNLAERYVVCKNLHTEIRGESADIDTKLMKWIVNIDKQFAGELAQQVNQKLKSKMKNKIAKDFESNKPSMDYCRDLHKKITIDDITPDARKAVVRE